MLLYAIASPFVTVWGLVLFSPKILLPPPIIEFRSISFLIKFCQLTTVELTHNQ